MTEFNSPASNARCGRAFLRSSGNPFRPAHRYSTGFPPAQPIPGRSSHCGSATLSAALKFSRPYTSLGLESSTTMRLISFGPARLQRTCFSGRFQSSPQCPAHSAPHGLAFPAKLIHKVRRQSNRYVLHACHACIVSQCHTQSNELSYGVPRQSEVSTRGTRQSSLSFRRQLKADNQGRVRGRQGTFSLAENATRAQQVRPEHGP